MRQSDQVHRREFGAGRFVAIVIEHIDAGPAQPGGAAASVAHMRPCYQVALDAFGPDRMMYGSDWPPSTLGAPYPQILRAARLLTADLSAQDQAAIFGGTARRIYRLPEGA